MNRQLRRTPLWEVHRQSGARLVEFAGWEMPVQYTGINDEYQAVRGGAGLSDVSHMGQIEVAGPGALTFLQHLLPPDLGRVGQGQMCYAVMCDPAGGAIDDLMVCKTAEARYLLVVNAGRAAEDLAWIQDEVGGYPGVEVELRGAGWGMLALQGPMAPPVMEGAGLGAALQLAYLECRPLLWSGTELWVSRSGYTGEDGFELICPAAGLPALWQHLLDQGATPCGLGARDLARTEMGYCLYGHELTPQITPLEAGLAWSLCLGKTPAFIGQAALRQLAGKGGYRRLVGLAMAEQAIPRPGYPVLDGAGNTVGQVSSGTFSPGLQQGIALAFVAPHCRRPGMPLAVGVRGTPRSAVVTRTPFVPARTKNRRPGG